MLTLGEAIRLGVQALREVPDPKPDTIALLENVTEQTGMELRLNPQLRLTPEQEAQFRALLLLRAKREPLQYLLGTQCFYGYNFSVDSRVLIPRPETETLCELALKKLMPIAEPTVLDLCTGSGAIAVTLCRECAKAHVTACDVSADALVLARQNAAANGAEIRFLQGDLLAPVAGERFKLIVCNPPYVESAACDALQPEVAREPRLALDGGADGLDFYRRLATDAPACLADRGWMLMEIGDGQARQVESLLAQTHHFSDIELHLDLFGKERFVSARRAAFPT